MYDNLQNVMGGGGVKMNLLSVLKLLCINTETVNS